MVPKRLYACVFVLLVFSRASVASEQALSAIPVPPGSELQTVTINLLQNGHLLSIANLEGAASVESVLQFYREQWQEPLGENVPGFIEEEAGEWSVISRPTEEWNQVIQLKQGDSKIEGRVSVLRLEPSTDPLAAIAMPSGASLLSSTGADDVGHSSSTYVVFSKSGIRSMSDFYRRHFEDDGWSRVSDKKVESNQVLLLQRFGERLDIVVSRVSSGGTITIINKVLDNG